MSERQDEPEDPHAIETDNQGKPIDYANSLHRGASLFEALEHIIDSDHGRILNILDFPVGSYTVDMSDVR